MHTATATAPAVRLATSHSEFVLVGPPVPAPVQAPPTSPVSVEPVPSTAVPVAPVKANKVLEMGPITDQADTTSASGDPVTFLREVYTAGELAAGGPVTVTWSTRTDGAFALVPDAPARYPECLGAPRCILIDRARWDDPGWTNSYDAMRVMIVHEWGHVLSVRYQQWMTSEQYVAFVPVHHAVDEECLADTIATKVLARGAFPPNETEDYVVHYDCETFWGDDADELRPQAEALADDILAWAGTYSTE